MGKNILKKVAINFLPAFFVIALVSGMFVYFKGELTKVKENPLGVADVVNIQTSGSFKALGAPSSTFGNALIPNTDNAYDIGAPDGKNWRNAYFSGILNASGTAISGGSLSTSGTIAVGTSGILNATSTFYHGLNIGTRTGFNDGSLTIDPSGNINTSGSIFGNGADNVLSLNRTPTNTSGTFYVDRSGNLYSSGSMFFLPGFQTKYSNPTFSFFANPTTGVIQLGTVSNYSTEANLTGLVADGRNNIRELALYANGTRVLRSTLQNSGTAGDLRITGSVIMGESGTTINPVTSRLTTWHGGITVGGAVASTTVSSTFFALNTSAANASGTFYIDGAGNWSSSGSIAYMRNLAALGSTGNLVCINATTGKIESQATNCTVSSKRFKHDVENLDDEELLEMALKLKAKSYKRNADNILEYGFIAEDIVEISPLFVVYEKDKNGNLLPKTVDYERLTVLFAGANRALNNRLDKLEKEVRQTVWAKKESAILDNKWFWGAIALLLGLLFLYTHKKRQ